LKKPKQVTDRDSYIYEYVDKTMSHAMHGKWDSDGKNKKSIIAWLRKVHSRTWYQNFKQFGEEEGCDDSVLLCIWKFMEKHRRFQYQHHSISALESVLVLVAEKETEGVPLKEIQRMRLFEAI